MNRNKGLFASGNLPVAIVIFVCALSVFLAGAHANELRKNDREASITASTGNNLLNSIFHDQFIPTWNIPEFNTVSFDWNYAEDGFVNDIKIRDGGSFALPENSYIKDEMTFVGWKEETEDYIYQPGDMFEVDNDTKLYAQWMKDPYKAVFVGSRADGGHTSPIYFNKDDEVVLPECGYIRKGYYFDGWAISVAKKVYDAGDVVLLGESSIDRVTTLYATWKKYPTITITYDWNYADEGFMEKEKISDIYEVRECEYYKQGMLFDGWNTEMDGTGDNYQPGDVVVPSENITLYAQWKDCNQQSVTFDWNYADEGEMPAIKACPDQLFKLPENGFVKKSSYFVGWNTEPDGTGQQFENKGSLSVDEDTVLYAQWSNIPVGR